MPTRMARPIIDSDLPTLEHRASRARLAIAGYEDGAESLVDLLTDLRHLADAESIDFYHALDVSYRHYLAEREECAKS